MPEDASWQRQQASRPITSKQAHAAGRRAAAASVFLSGSAPHAAVPCPASPTSARMEATKTQPSSEAGKQGGCKQQSMRGISHLGTSWRVACLQSACSHHSLTSIGTYPMRRTKLQGRQGSTTQCWNGWRKCQRQQQCLRAEKQPRTTACLACCWQIAAARINRNLAHLLMVV